MTTAQNIVKKCKFMGKVAFASAFLALSGCSDGTTTDPLTQAEREAKARQQIIAHPNYCMTNHNHAQLTENAGFTPGTAPFIGALMDRKLTCLFVTAAANQSHMNWEAFGTIAGTSCNTAISSFSTNQVNTREAANRNTPRDIVVTKKMIETWPNHVADFEASRTEQNFQGF